MALQSRALRPNRWFLDLSQLCRRLRSRSRPGQRSHTQFSIGDSGCTCVQRGSRRDGVVGPRFQQQGQAFEVNLGLRFHGRVQPCDDTPRPGDAPRAGSRVPAGGTRGARRGSEPNRGARPTGWRRPQRTAPTRPEFAFDVSGAVTSFSTGTM